jgi:hypothetical protein
MGDTGKTRNLSHTDPCRPLCRIRSGARRQNKPGQNKPAPGPPHGTPIDSTTGPATRPGRVYFVGENRIEALNLPELDLAIR